MTRDHLPKAKFQSWTRTFLVWAALILPGVTGFAQDLHYSQFYGAPLHLNPSLTGIFRGDVRLMGQYRNQWAKIPVGYTTFTGAVDFKAIGEREKDNFLAFGLGYNHDIAGFSDLRLNNLTLNGAFTKKLGKRFYGSLGGQLGYGNRKWKADQVTYDNQFDPKKGTFDPNNPSKELNADQNLSFGDFGLGFNVRYQVKERAEFIDTFGYRTKIDFGAGFFHLNRPNQFFTEAGAIKLPVRFTPYILGNFQVSNRWDIMANVAAQFQSTYRQYLGGLGAKYFFNRTPGKQFAMQAGLTWRFDALTDDSATFPAIEAHYNNIRVGFSYDINFSRFNSSADGGTGGPELFIHYHIAPYKHRKTDKICPLI
jgi:type IX secretion system PorP/SprF family membrane protein